MRVLPLSVLLLELPDAFCHSRQYPGDVGLAYQLTPIVLIDGVLNDARHVERDVEPGIPGTG